MTDHTGLVRVKVDATGRGESQTTARRGAKDRIVSVRNAIQSLDLPSDLERREATVKHKSSLFDADEDDPPYRAPLKCTLTCRPSQIEDVFFTVGDAGGDVLSMDRFLAPERRDLSRYSRTRVRLKRTARESTHRETPIAVRQN